MLILIVLGALSACLAALVQGRRPVRRRRVVMGRFISLDTRIVATPDPTSGLRDPARSL